MIKVKFRIKPIPHILAYVKSFDQDIGGCANGIFIRILAKYEGDEGIYQHELEHVRQFYRTLGMHGFLYRFSRKYRMRSEVEAYKVQLQYPPACNDVETYRSIYAVMLMSHRYNLKITLAEAIELLGG